MKWLLGTTAVLLSLGLLLAGPPGRVFGAELPQDPKALLELLKARDAQVDNALISYTRRGEYTPPSIPDWKYPPRLGEKLPSDQPEPMSFRFDEQLIVRGPNTTFVRDSDPALSMPEPSASDTTFLPHQKWSNTEGLDREIRENEKYDDLSLDISRGGSTPVGVVDAQRRDLEFSLGFGFGSRIKEVRSVTLQGNRLTLEGVIQLWWEDLSTFHLTLDEDLVVREAEIEVEAGGNQTRYDISTEGSVKDGDFVFAKTGHFKRTALGLKNPPVKLDVPFKPQVTDEFFADFQSAKFHLSDEEYTALTAMDPPPGTHVRDAVKNQRYHVGEKGQITRMGQLANTAADQTSVPRSGFGRGVFLGIVAFHIIILVVLVKLLRMRATRRVE